MKFKLLFLFLILLTPALAQETELTVDPGILPDSPFYFIDELFERVGDDPEKALRYKEEKLAEALLMAEKGKTEHTKKTLKKIETYSRVLEKEVTPEMEIEIKKKSKAVEKILDKISEDIPELKDEVLEQIEKEEQIELAADVSKKVEQLCRTLSKLDPVQYAATCKSDEDSADWQKDLDEELTGEQKEHAEVFADKLKQCFKTEGRDCDCKGMGVKSFEDLCIRGNSRYEKCEAGDQEACSGGDEEIDFSDYLPDYLLPVIEDLMSEFDDRDREDFKDLDRRDFPLPCQEAGAATPEACRKILENLGPGDFDDDFEPRPEDFPRECRDAGAITREACKRLMDSFGPDHNFEDHDGEFDSRRDFNRRGPSLDFGKDCHSIEDLAEKVKCLESFYDSARDSFGDFDPGEDYREDIRYEDEQDKFREEYRREFDDGEFKEEYRREFEHRETDFEPSPEDYPDECRRMGALTKDECRKVMEEHNNPPQEDKNRDDFDHNEDDFEPKYPKDDLPHEDAREDFDDSHRDEDNHEDFKEPEHDEPQEEHRDEPPHEDKPDDSTEHQ
jgi:hypothetical protein